MGNPFKGNKNDGGAPPSVNQNENPVDETKVDPPQGDGDPSSTGGTAGEENKDQDNADTNGDQQQGGENKEDGDKSEEKPSENPPPPPPSLPEKEKICGEKKRVKCAALKWQKVIVGMVEIQADGDGVIEVPVEQAARLLSIPGYEEA
jgi:hypothetical protein